METVEADVAKGLVSPEKAQQDYGVVVGDQKASQQLRDKIRAERDEGELFDFGPSLDEILARCQEKTGLPAPVAPVPLPWAPMESAEEARKRVLTQDDR